MIDSQIDCEHFLQHLQTEICKFYALHFTNGNIHKAKDQLENHH